MKCSTCSQPVTPVVALDVDGTLGRYHEHFLDFLEMYCDRPMPITAWDFDGVGEFSDACQMEKKEYQEAKLAFRAGGFKRWMPAFDGVAELIWQIQLSGAELWVTTTRPWMRMDNIDHDTREWLRRNGIPFDRLLFDERKYEELAQRVDPDRIIYILDDQEDMYDQADAIELPIHLIKTKWSRAIQRPRTSSSLYQAAHQVRTASASWREHHDGKR